MFHTKRFISFERKEIFKLLTFFNSLKSAVTMSNLSDQETINDICTYADENEIKAMFKEYLKRYDFVLMLNIGVVFE
jgi:hypothetical protein